MDDLKIGFKKWLQENFSKSTAYASFSLVQKIFDKNFENSENWKEQSEIVMPLLARYFEFANREYYLDRVTVWYALDYFDELTEFIYPKNLSNYEPLVSLYLYDGKKDYFICKVPLYRLSDHLKYLSARVYEYDISSNLDDREPFDILLPLPEIYDNIEPLDVKDAAIHIVYENTNNSAEKAALTRYCDFLYFTTHSLAFDYKNNPTVNMVANKNPRKHPNYVEDIPITGEHAQQIKYYYNPSRSAEILDCVLTIDDLKKIFKVGAERAKCLINEISKKCSKTVIDTYYSISCANICLKKHHKIAEKLHDGVDYKLEGYDYWITRKEATEILDISHNCFENCVSTSNCTHIDYSNLYIRYYKKDVEYLAAQDDIIVPRRRKKVYLLKNQNINK